MAGTSVARPTVYWMSRFYIASSVSTSYMGESGISLLTASTPAWLELCELVPPSRVWRVKVVLEEMSVRYFFKKVWAYALT